MHLEVSSRACTIVVGGACGRDLFFIVTFPVELAWHCSGPKAL